MAAEDKDQGEVIRDLRKKLAFAVKTTQWSYAIFWSISSAQQGILKWSEGYYNGDIKTTKTMQAGEIEDDHLGLQRTEQLRGLYESLSVGKTISPQAKRPSAALSPEDLSDTEWYFLVCMSFVFNLGQGLPGRTLEKNQTIWLCNAHQADSRVFSRSLLAKSASIQTVVCFPYSGGVIELGVTELVLEDPSLIQHIKASFLKNPYSVSKVSSNGSCRSIRDNVCKELDQETPQQNFALSAGAECRKTSSLSNFSNEFSAKLQKEEPIISDGVNKKASQIQSRHVMEEDNNNDAYNSTNLSDCISQNHGNSDKVSPLPNKMKLDRHEAMQRSSQDRLRPSDHQDDDRHYQGILSTLLKSSDQLTLGPYLRGTNKESIFSKWKKEALHHLPQSGTSQMLLKKVLFEVGQRHGDNAVGHINHDSRTEEVPWKPEAEEANRGHVRSETRRGKMSERFAVLESLVPMKGKVDKVSLLDHTIEYLKELKRRVQELESQKITVEQELTTKIKPHDTNEHTSDNYGATNNCNRKKAQMKKRKIHEVGTKVMM